MGRKPKAGMPRRPRDAGAPYLDSGWAEIREVIVRASRSDLHLNRTALGQTTHLGTPVGQSGTPGSIQLTLKVHRSAVGCAHGTRLPLFLAAS
jgi:hypothetical protein